MLSTSLTTLDQTEWALKYDWWQESIGEEQLVQPGMMWVGMGNYLLRFPNTNKNVYFKRESTDAGEGDISRPPISVRTYDGLIVDLQLEITYRLNIEHIRDLYMLVGEGGDCPASTQCGWHSFLVHVTMGVIDNLATSFNARDFYVNRTTVSEIFDAELSKVLSSQLFIDLQTLQLQDVDFSQAKAYEKSIVDTSNWERSIGIVRQTQLTKRIQQETLYLTAQKLANTTIINAQGDAAQTELNNVAEVTQFKYRQLQDAKGYKQQLDEFRTTLPEAQAIGSFLNYMQTRALAKHAQNKLTFKLADTASSR
jgi:regulator of protease activity HflC (stomatin/prohibitin superfamily)